MLMAESYAYVAIRECGCICGAAVDNPEHRAHWADDVAEWLRAGFRIERIPCEAARTGRWKCATCHPPAEPSLFDTDSPGSSPGA